MMTFDKPRTRRRTIALVILAVVLGVGDQYLGSWSAYPLATEISMLAAPWLVFPFIVGCTQSSARRASTLATICTFVALLGYNVMTLSPIENAQVSLFGVLGLLGGQIVWFLLGGVTSPFLGWLGYRWRTTRTP